jgi:hypothetical protein
MISAASRPSQDSSENPTVVVDAVPSANEQRCQHGGTMQAEAWRLKSYDPTHV